MLPTIGGKAIWGGGFSVAKAANSERRWIALGEPIDDYIDSFLVPPVPFPYLPQLRSVAMPLRTDTGVVARALASERDARHYSHTLRSSENSIAWLKGESTVADEMSDANLEVREWCGHRLGDLRRRKQQLKHTHDGIIF